MKTNTSQNILKYIAETQPVSAKSLTDHFNISAQAIFRHLSKLQQNNQIYKVGIPPKVFYYIKAEEKTKREIPVDEVIKREIDNNYLLITSTGEKLDGWRGFVYWCEKQQLPVEKTAREYIATLKKYAVYKKEGIIDGMNKMKSTFDQVYLDKVFYLDFYSIERFGKTKLGQLLLYAKQSRNKKLIRELIDMIRPDIERLVTSHKIDGVGFVPPTVRRDVQFMHELRKGLHLQKPEMVITKIKTDVIVPQKTLNSLADRVDNAKRTFIVEKTIPVTNVLLLDDAVGSGATLNEIAKKMKEKGVAKYIIGLSITGSFKGFDVISEV